VKANNKGLWLLGYLPLEFLPDFQLSPQLQQTTKYPDYTHLVAGYYLAITNERSKNSIITSMGPFCTSETTFSADAVCFASDKLFLLDISSFKSRTDRTFAALDPPVVVFCPP
jgi:hypothetical protein